MALLRPGRLLLPAQSPCGVEQRRLAIPAGQCAQSRGGMSQQPQDEPGLAVLPAAGAGLRAAVQHPATQGTHGCNDQVWMRR